MHASFNIRLFVTATSIVLTLGACFDTEKSVLKSTCHECTQQECKPELLACGGDPVCRARNQCLEECLPWESECRIKCTGRTSQSAEMKALDSCRGAKCREDCDTCGASMFDPRGAECSRCMRGESACGATTACASDTECSGILRDRMWCEDPYCQANEGQPYSSNRVRQTTTVRTNLENELQNCVEECNLGTDFGCLRSYNRPLLSELQGGKTSVSLIPRDLFVSGFDALKGVELEASLGDDSSTVIPLPELDDGTHLLTVDEPFTGTISAEKEDYFPLTTFYSRPLFGNEQWIVPLFLEIFITGFQDAFGEEVDFENKGVLAVSAMDCAQFPAPGVAIKYTKETEPGSRIFKFTPYGGIVESGAPAITDATGTVLFFNVPPGSGIVTLAIDSKGGSLNMADVTVYPGRISWIAVFPQERVNKR